MSDVSTIETDLRFSAREDFWIIIPGKSVAGDKLKMALRLPIVVLPARLSAPRDLKPRRRRPCESLFD